MSRKQKETVQQSTGSQNQQSVTSQTQRTQSESERVLSEALLGQILSGLTGGMTDEEIAAFAENLLMPQKNAALEAAQGEYDTKALSIRQEKEDIAAQLARDIAAQQSAYRQSTANVENAALARGMGRSSYTLASLANQGSLLAQAVLALTQEAGRKDAQAQERLTLAAEQNAKTQGRMQQDYAANLAAKIQEMKNTQRQEANQNYMTAISSALGQRTNTDSQGGSVTQTNTASTENLVKNEYEDDNPPKRT